MKLKKLIIIAVLLTIAIPSLQGSAKEQQAIFYVQTGIYDSVPSALAEFNKLIKHNMPANLESFGQFTKVVSGYYKEHNTALAVVDKLQKLGVKATVKSTALWYNKYKNNSAYNVLIKTYKLNEDMISDITLLKSYQHDFKTRTTDKALELYMGQYSDRDEAANKALELQKLGFNCSITKGRLIDLLDSSLLEEQNNGTYQTKNFILSNDQVLAGLYGSHTLYFYKNENWSLVNKPYFELKYQRNQIAATRNSTVTVMLNEQPVYSEVTKESNSLKIYFDPAKINNGYNSVTIKCFNRISDLPCEDDLNPANWLKVYGDSYISLSFINTEDSISLSDFPYPYINKGLNQPVNMQFIIADNADADELAAYTMFSALFGSIENSYDSKIEFNKYSDKLQLNKSCVFISKRAKLPNLLKKYFTNSEMQQSDNTLIKEVYSPFNKSKKMLIILLGNQETYGKLLNSLKDENISKQMNSTSYLVTADTVISQSNKKLDSEISLNQLGYAGVQVEGLFTHNVKYNLKVPSNWQANDDVKFDLHLRYSDILDFSKSLVTVKVNDIPIGSKALSQNKANDDYLQFIVPKDALSSYGSYNIEVQLSLYIKDTYCETRVEKSVWAYIVNDSFISYPFVTNSHLTIDKFDGLFLHDQDFSNTNIALPSKPTAQEISTALRVSNHIGRYANKIGNISVSMGSVPTDLNSNNIVIFNNQNAGSLLSETNKTAYVKYSNENQVYESTEKIPLIDTNYIGSVQIVPYKSGYKQLLINAKNEIALKQVKMNLTNSQALYLMNGDVSLVNNKGLIKTAVYNPQLEQYLASQSKEATKNKSSKKPFQFKIDLNSVKLIVLVLSIMVMLIGTVIYLRRK